MIYVSSRVKYADVWKMARIAGYPIKASWIDVETPDWDKLWDTCIHEAHTCSALVLYAPDTEILKGALIEVGAAMAAKKPVYYAGLTGTLPLGNLLHNPRIIVTNGLLDALDRARAFAWVSEDLK